MGRTGKEKKNINAVDAKFKNITVSFANVTGKLKVSQIEAGGLTVGWHRSSGQTIKSYGSTSITDKYGKSHTVITNITVGSEIGSYLGRS